MKKQTIKIADRLTAQPQSAHPEFNYSVTYDVRTNEALPRQNYSFLSSEYYDHADAQISLSGWGKVAAGGLDYHVFPPPHPLNMFHQPYIQLLAEKWRACLDDAARVISNQEPSIKYQEPATKSQEVM